MARHVVRYFLYLSVSAFLALRPHTISVLDHGFTEWKKSSEKEWNVQGLKEKLAAVEAKQISVYLRCS